MTRDDLLFLTPGDSILTHDSEYEVVKVARTKRERTMFAPGDGVVVTLREGRRVWDRYVLVDGPEILSPARLL